MQQSGMSVTKYLQHVGINYNTYNYWRKKLKENDSPKPELAPIRTYAKNYIGDKKGLIAGMWSALLR